MNLPYPITLRLWDYIFCEGHPAVFFVAVSILHDLEGELSRTPQSKTISHSLGLGGSTDELLEKDMEGIFLLLGTELSHRDLNIDRIIRWAVRFHRRARKSNYLLFRRIVQLYNEEETSVP